MEIIIKYLQVFIKYRKMIFYNALVFTFIAIIVSFILPKRYRATAQILPPQEEQDLLGFSTMLGANISSSSLSRIARGGLFRSATTSDLIAAILQSRTIREEVVSECSIIKLYKVRKKSMERAVKLLKKLTKIKVTDEGIVEINVEAKTPVLARDIANSYISAVDKFLKESNMSRGRNMRIFIEKRLESAERELKQASESLRIFQEKNKLVALDEETKAVIDAYAQLKSELLKKEMELEISKDFSTPDNPYILSTKREVSEFKRQLQELESGKRKDGFGAGFAIAFNKLPAVAQEYAQKLRDFKVQEEIYAFLLKQYEQAKILEARDTPAITILDYARIPEKKSFPKRAAIILIVFFASAIMGFLVAIINEYLITLQNTKPSEYQSWQITHYKISNIKIQIIAFLKRNFIKRKNPQK